MPTTTESTLDVAPGSTIVVRDAEWIVTKAEPSKSGLRIECQGLRGLVQDQSAVFFEDLEGEGGIQVLDPAHARVKADSSSKYRDTRLWLEATLRKSPVPLYEPALTVAEGGLADPLAYQRAAVAKALSTENLRPRILIADAVGLGKTIEIGMILSELVRRGRGERILIVTPRHVLEQMQHEMWTRFALPFVRLDSIGIQKVRQQLPATRNPFSMYRRAIISIDTLKQPKYQQHLRKHRWDAVVIDESHNITGKTQNNDLARILAPNAEALILASATPHNGRKESFAELIRLLEPTAVSPEGEFVQGEVERLVVRRHRHSPEVAQEVGDAWAERLEPRHVPVAPSSAEQAVATELAEVWLHPTSGATPYSGENKGLFPWTLAKAFLSSPKALAETLRDRIRRLEGGTSEQRREVEALERLQALNAGSLDSSAKYQALLDELRSIGISKTGDRRVVIFSERVPTLEWLAERLRKDLKMSGEQVAVMHGQLADTDMMAVVERFKQKSDPVRILVTGDVASEGVNLHAQCHHLIHFDIPWSLIRIEQRNGRIDRYGQRHRPQITTLLLDPAHDRFAGDVRVLQRLIDREHEAHGALGDVASLMGKHSVDAEEDAIRTVLTGSKELDEVVQPIEAAMSNDDVFALLFGAAVAPAEAAPPARAASLYADHADFLEQALRAVYAEPSSPPDNGGVGYRRDAQHGTIELQPDRALRRRLGALPQSYRQERRVDDRLLLATTRARASASLQDARESKSSTTQWPEAHFLAPMHPVLEWASDRVLTKLGRNEVYVVRGDVAAPTVLLLATLTNRRGQTIGASYSTVAFPQGADGFPMVQVQHAADALEDLGLDVDAVNPGPVDAGSMQRYIAPAVRHAEAAVEQQMEALRQHVDAQVRQWSSRVASWRDEADALVQRKELQARRVSVDQEAAIADAMTPNRKLVRPLVVVVPIDTPVAQAPVSHTPEVQQ